MGYPDPGSTAEPFRSGDTTAVTATPQLDGAEVDDKTPTGAGEPGAAAKPHRPLVKLNVLKDKPLAGGNTTSREGQGDDPVGGDEVEPATGTNVERIPSHRPGVGKISVRDLIKREHGAGDNEGAPADATG